MVLDSLPESKATELIAGLWPGRNVAALPASTLSQIYRRTNGVPLYVEELAQWLGTLADSTLGDLRDSLSSARILSFESVLLARLGALGPAKAVAQAASVIGPEFDESLLQELLPGEEPARLSAILDSLVEARVTVREPRGDRTAYSFRHSLIQETVTGTLLRKARAALHQRAYAAATSGRIEMPPGTIGLHAENAGLLKAAVQQFIAAAKMSFGRSAVIEARQIVDHVFHLLGRLPEDDDRECLELSALAALGPVLTVRGEPGRRKTCALYERAVEIARRRPAQDGGPVPGLLGLVVHGSGFRRPAGACGIGDVGPRGSR